VVSFHALINGGSIFLIPALSPTNTSLRTGSEHSKFGVIGALRRICCAPSIAGSLFLSYIYTYSRGTSHLENNRGENSCREGKIKSMEKSQKKCSSLTRMILSQLSCNCLHTNIFPHCFTIKRRIIPLHFSDIARLGNLT